MAERTVGAGIAEGSCPRPAINLLGSTARGGRVRRSELRVRTRGKLGASPYQALAKQIESQVGGIVANCKLEPKADAMLRIVIADIGAGTDAKAGKNAKLPPAQGLVKVAQAVNAYGSHFDHPGFKPIPNSH